jgi:glycosyltransferase involved in cell wall biosynthesis
MRPPRTLGIIDAIRRSDVVLTQGVDLSATWPLFLLFAHKPAVWDLTSPVTLENLARWQGGTTYQNDLLRLGLRRGDFFICGGERQKDLYRGAFATIRSGRADGICATVPFGIPGEAPRRTGRGLREMIPAIEDEDFVILWPGGIWDWTDPITPLKAMAGIARRRRDVHLVFLGTESPAPHEGTPRMSQGARGLASELGLLDEQVHFLSGWQPYDGRGTCLLDADLGISAHGTTAEARFAYRSRLLDCIWAGLPVVCTAGDEMGDRVGETGMGKAVPPGDVEAWVEAVEGALRGESWYREAPGIMASLRPELTWERRLAPLEMYLRRPKRTSRGWAALPGYGGSVLGLLRRRIRERRGV